MYVKASQNIMLIGNGHDGPYSSMTIFWILVEEVVAVM